ncbi:MAG: hypothetical protein COW00_16365 [Bdellovibrio sp. CG12_big_fil_rev_8_21_14_0_65_39_13]|nr:MAG: hypothetical protein COW00_16365 [Bdellovibrio sp. CG12_big_fil_rev_8_21_14_0_65_39_13]PJB54029.1 MAG: hypothetical protein CO099_03850 [Bdellovibrio sp. CG_4_9_14_3_um_filter_39_7]
MFFKIFVPTLFLVIWFYLRHRILRLFILPWGLPKWSIYFFDLFLIGTGFFRYLYRDQDASYYTTSAKSLFYVGYLAMAWVAYLLITVVVYDLFRLFKRKIKKQPVEEVKIERRDFLKKGLSLVGFGAIQMTSTAAAVSSSMKINLKKQTLFHPNLPEIWDGYRIAQVSDLHLGPIIDRKYLQEVCDKLNQNDPHIYVLTGDMIDGKADVLREQLEPFRHVNAPEGKFFITGNHEYYWNVQEWVNLFSDLGYQHLLNSNAILSRENSKLLISGIPDVGGHRYHQDHKVDFKKAFQNEIATDFKILLSHRPETCELAAQQGFNLQLSGHTHGGQSIPFNWIVAMVQKYLKGTYTVDDLLLYVSTGTGFWGPPIRLGVPNEATLITLKKGPFSANTSGTFHS